jgi:hypothetical protein
LQADRDLPAQDRGLQLTDPLPGQPEDRPDLIQRLWSTLNPNRWRMTCAFFGCKAAKPRSTPAASSFVWASSSGETA